MGIDLLTFFVIPCPMYQEWDVIFSDESLMNQSAALSLVSMQTAVLNRVDSCITVVYPAAVASVELTINQSKGTDLFVTRAPCWVYLCLIVFALVN